MAFNPESQPPRQMESASPEWMEKVKSEAKGIKVHELNQIDFPEKARSYELGPCIAVGIYNPTTKRAYMRHEINMQSVDLGQTVKEIRDKEKSNNSDLSQLKVVVTGNSLTTYSPTVGSDKEYHKSVLENRAYTEDNLKKALVNNGFMGEIIFRWLVEDATGELFVDTEAGNFIINSRRYRLEESGNLAEFDEKMEIF